MARIRGANTGPELAVRRVVHARKFRYRLHRHDLPGRPDLVLPRYKLAVFVHGCFWHGCPECDRGRRSPKSNVAFWSDKLRKNRERDSRHLKALAALGWRTAVIWECTVRDPDRLEHEIDRILPASGSVTANEPFTVADFFSCGGGTSAGFSRRAGFRIVGAVDLELAKPSGGAGASQCNATYAANHGVRPLNRDMMELAPEDFARFAGIAEGALNVMISCAPCTDLSRAKPANHLVDSSKNSLISRSGDFVEALRPEIMFMENARELINGKFRHHHDALCDRLRKLGYDVRSAIHFLSDFGLPQIRERALIVASRIGPARTLGDLWEGWRIKPSAVTVRSAMARLKEWQSGHSIDPEGNISPGMTPRVLARAKATPPDGGGWVDVARNPKTRKLLTPDCLRRWTTKDLGSHPDVYGRMWWDRPAPTIKRECAHVGNGRYMHPVLDRLLTVREMSTLQGFPFDYKFPAEAVANRYRHIGDAVPPLIAYQISALAVWMKTGIRPVPADWVMPNTTLRTEDIVPR
jgi:DNA (cytosine-5)-methyltransferase 1